MRDASSNQQRTPTKTKENKGPRILREKNVVSIMIHKYCMGQGHDRNKSASSGTVELCTECLNILQYAHLHQNRG